VLISIGVLVFNVEVWAEVQICSLECYGGEGILTAQECCFTKWVFNTYAKPKPSSTVVVLFSCYFTSTRFVDCI
jgi:hypothetical protein